VTRTALPNRRIYLAGPMRGIPHFNFPAFHAGAQALRDLGHTVVSPAERDEAVHGGDFSARNLNGDNEHAATSFGFNLREALCDDLTFICREADAVVLLPGWQQSKGALAERATAEALGLAVYEIADLIGGRP
jgi:hypothetical protein